MTKILFPLLARLIPRRTIDRWAKKMFARWPRRQVRGPLPVLLVDVPPREARPGMKLNHLLRQRGFTTGDRVIILLESDYQHVCDVAQAKLTNGLRWLDMYWSHADELARLRVPTRVLDNFTGQVD